MRPGQWYLLQFRSQRWLCCCFRYDLCMCCPGMHPGIYKKVYWVVLPSSSLFCDFCGTFCFARASLRGSLAGKLRLQLPCSVLPVTVFVFSAKQQQDRERKKSNWDFPHSLGIIALYIGALGLLGGWDVRKWRKEKKRKG